MGARHFQSRLRTGVLCISHSPQTAASTLRGQGRMGRVAICLNSTMLRASGVREVPLSHTKFWGEPTAAN